MIAQRLRHQVPAEGGSFFPSAQVRMEYLERMQPDEEI
jgi:hypothetical protein